MKYAFRLRAMRTSDDRINSGEANAIFILLAICPVGQRSVDIGNDTAVVKNQ